MAKSNCIDNMEAREGPKKNYEFEFFFGYPFWNVVHAV
jgi:hypothetical protein